MPTDIAFPFEYTEGGDVAAVSGTEFYRQHALQLGLIAVETRLGEALTANGITDLEAELTAAYERTPYFTSPVTVTVTDVDPRTETVDLTVRLGDGRTFEVPLERPDTEAVTETVE